MRLVDSHTHLYGEEFDADRDEVIARAIRAGVNTMMCPAVDIASYEPMLELCRRYPANCFPMMGLHPTSINDNPQWRQHLAAAERYLSESSPGTFRAVGEVGLDLHWSREWFGQQEEAFARQLELSVRYGLPLVIHTRDAWPEMIAALREFNKRAEVNLKGIMHSFSGTMEDYKAVKECGDFLFGIGGPVTYKNSAMAKVVAEIPLSDMVLETDSPYLPPVPMRGKRNESSLLPSICAKVAAIKGLRPEEVAAITTANALRIFGIDIG